MNVDTGEIRDMSELSDQEKASGKWVPLSQRDLHRLAQLETERLARRNGGITAEQVQRRLDRAEAKRRRRARIRHAPDDQVSKDG